MAPLLLRFVVWLYAGRDTGPVGAQFHRWLPDGEKDRLTLVNQLDRIVSVWFERRGYMLGGLIRYDRSRKEVDATVIPRQGRLEAGNLRGKIELYHVPGDICAAIQQGQKGDALYVTFARRVTKEVLFPPVSRFINTLRSNYGQYWLQEFKPWDSRRETLGAYCREFLLEWSLDHGLARWRRRKAR